MSDGSLGQRMRQARRRAKLTLEGVGKRLGAMVNRPQGPYSAQAVQQWEKDETVPDVPTIRAFADLVRCDLNWLITGIFTTPLPENGQGVERVYGTTLPGGRVVAIIDTLKAVSDPIDYESEESLHTRNPVSKKGFAIRIFDKRNAPEFEEGDVVVIDPDKKPQPGEMVFAVIDGEPVFGEYLRLGRQKSRPAVALAALNSRWEQQDLGDKDRVVGTMTEHTKAGGFPRHR